MKLDEATHAQFLYFKASQSPHTCSLPAAANSNARARERGRRRWQKQQNTPEREILTGIELRMCSFFLFFVCLKAHYTIKDFENFLDNNKYLYQTLSVLYSQ